MSVRFKRVLKFFALIIFTLELMGSVCFVDTSSEEKSGDTAQIHDINSLQNIYYPILLEELTENEKEKDGHKPLLSNLWCLWQEIYPHSLDVHQADLTTYVSTLEQGASPALFQVHCTLLI